MLGDAIGDAERIRSGEYTHNSPANAVKGTGIKPPYYFETMSKLTYRGNCYNANNEALTPSSSECCYRGVVYTPVEQEVYETPDVTLTYRGVEYKSGGFNALARIQRKQQRVARQMKARKMPRNASAIF